jgi:hypothetical protein
MSEPYVKKDPGDIIRAQDWNDMQSRARDAIERHTHSGTGQGPLLTGAAIDPTAALKVKSVTADTLSVAGADLSARLKALLDQVNAALPLAGGTLSGALVAGSGVRLNNADLRLRGDDNHGLGYYGSDKRFGGQALDGPVLYGWAGGGLGTTNGGQRLALSWDAQQNLSWGGNNAMLRADQGGSLELGGNDSVAGRGTPYIDFHYQGQTQDFNVRLVNSSDKTLTVQGTLAVTDSFSVAGTLTVAGSHIYFTKTDLTFTAKGNTTGWAAIENAKNYDALMIVGRAGSQLPGGGTGRHVQVWDFLSVAGSMQVKANLRMQGTDIFLRDGSDINHGLGWHGTGKGFAGQTPDGPVLYGYSGGGLGSTNGGQRLALTWDAQQNVRVSGKLTAVNQNDWRQVAQFQSGWANFGGEWPPAAFMIDSLGFVHLRGLVNKGQIGSGQTVFMLPPGFRPRVRYLHCTNRRAEDGGRTDVYPDGRVVPVAGISEWLSLDGIIFQAA